MGPARQEPVAEELRSTDSTLSAKGLCQRFDGFLAQPLTGNCLLDRWAPRPHRVTVTAATTSIPQPEISVVVPCHNERDNLRPLADAIRTALDPLKRSYEVVLVDDGSSDGSWDLLQKMCAEDRRICGLRLGFQSGQSAAMWAGMRSARGDVIITLDADLQNPPNEIPRFLDALKGADCVCGSRVAARAEGDSWVRIASSRIANWVRNKLSGETISDAGCCFRAFKKQCITEVKFFKGGHRFLPTLIKMEGYSVVEIAIGHNPRHAGSAHYGVWNRLFKSFGDLLAVRWMKTRVIRYKIAEKLN